MVTNLEISYNHHHHLHKSFKSIWHDLLYGRSEDRRVRALLALRDELPLLLDLSSDEIGGDAQHSTADHHRREGTDLDRTKIFQLKLIFLTIDFLMNYPTSAKYITGEPYNIP